MDYEMVLGEYGGDNRRGRQAYRMRVEGDIVEGLEIKGKVIGQSLLGGEEFVEWISENFVKGEKDRDTRSWRITGIQGQGRDNRGN